MLFATTVPEISDQYYPVDDAMRGGYVWDFGPFEYWDLIGFQNGVKKSLKHWGRKSGLGWANAKAGADQFYKYEKEKRNIMT